MNGKFKYPITFTRHLLRIRYEEVFLDNPDKQFIDIGESVPFYEFNTNLIPRYNCTEYVPQGSKEIQIHPDRVASIFKRKLTEVANAYKWKSEKRLWILLERVADILKSRFIGYSFTDKEVEEWIGVAHQNRDTMEVEPNTTIRFLTNPYFQGAEERNYPGMNNTEYLHHLKTTFKNECLGRATRDNNYEAIHNALCDYNLILGLVTCEEIGKEAGVNEKTVRNYMKEHPELREIYEALRANSGKSKKRKTTSKAKQKGNGKNLETAQKQGLEENVQKTENRSVYSIREEIPENTSNVEEIKARIEASLYNTSQGRLTKEQIRLKKKHLEVVKSGLRPDD